MAGVVVVFDFDKTIIDVDSDNWVVDGLGATDLFDRLLPTMPWNTLIDTVMGELHAQGKTLRDVADVLRAAPIDPHVVAAIRAAYRLGGDRPETLLRLISRVLVEESTLLPLDCKFESLPVAGGRPMPLGVKN
ncbi:Inorganic pyrophosphatase 1 [Triticum urartu]|uniref:Inorganic pyrophosphatase 1 n=1 Tax=Triticum urartu TaxID=4572 RepID=M7ZCU9_TRIUA|nr:Inorganic pyrophosphatase 1 [Triticum urartu]